MSMIARRPMLVAAAAVITLASLALIGLGLAQRPTPEPKAMGPRMAIDLVAPREPEVIEGGILEVGQVRDGFDDRALQPSVPIDDPTLVSQYAVAAAEDAPVEPPLMPRPSPIAAHATVPPQGVAEAQTDPLDDGSRWFGLDRMVIAAEQRSTKEE